MEQNLVWLTFKSKNKPKSRHCCEERLFAVD